MSKNRLDNQQEKLEIIKSLEQKFPNKKIMFFFKNHKQLYNRIKKYCKKNNIPVYQDFLYSLGYDIVVKRREYDGKYTEKYIIDELERCYPDKIIKNISTSQRDLFSGIKDYCIRNNKDYKTFFKFLGYEIIHRPYEGDFTKDFIVDELEKTYPNKKIYAISKENQKLYIAINSYCKRNDISNYWDFLNSLGYSEDFKSKYKYTKKFIINGLKKEYPDKIIINITKNNYLYQALLAYCKRENIPDYKKVLKTLGYTFKKRSYSGKYTKEFIIKGLKNTYPDKKVIAISSVNAPLYNGIKKYCKRNNISSHWDFLTNLGYTYEK